jgi:Zn-dependent protease
VSQLWGPFVATLPLLLISLVFHELSHGLVANWLGDPTARLQGRLTLNPIAHLDPLGTAILVLTFLNGHFLFGWARPVPVDPANFRDRQRGMMLVGAAGPLANVVLAAASGLTVRLTVPASVFVAQIFYIAFVLNVVLAVINLVPLPPLDGSRVLGGLLPPALYSRWAALDRFASYALLLLFLVVIARPGALSATFGRAIDGAGNLIIGRHALDAIGGIGL